MYFFEKNKFKIIISAVAFVLVIIIAVSSVTGARIPVISDTVNFIVYPFQKTAIGVYNGIESFTSMLRSNKNYARENEQLKERIAALEDKIRQNDSYSKENDRLRQMLELTQKDTGFEYIAADVTASDMTNWSRTFTINKGLVDGVQKNCAVITVNGLVGHVKEVGRNWARVVSVIDTDSSVGASITRLGVNAVVNGDIALSGDNKCVMDYLIKDTNIEVGDYVVTSGNGGIYPAGLYIGKVTELNDDASGLSRQAVIEPGVDFYDLSEVLVVKKQ